MGPTNTAKQGKTQNDKSTLFYPPTGPPIPSARKVREFLRACPFHSKLKYLSFVKLVVLTGFGLKLPTAVVLDTVGRRNTQMSTKVGITAACYRTEKAQIPKSAGESAGKSAGKKGTAGGTAGSSAESSHFLWKSRETALLQQSPSSPLFPGALPSTLPGTFGDLGFFSPVAGGCDSYTKVRKRKHAKECKRAQKSGSP